MNRFALSIFLLATLAVGAQNAPSRKLFQVGATYEQIIARFGQPIPSQFVPEKSGAHYLRHGRKSDYLARVIYYVDDSRSRIRPTLRVEEVRFKVDKHITVGQALSDLPEVREICAEGCSLTQGNYGSGLQLCPGSRVSDRLRPRFHGRPVITIWKKDDGDPDRSWSQQEAEQIAVWASGRDDICDGKNFGTWAPSME
ncbi:MAG: hypothetical protein LAN64_20580 [Acidobacteriia bacterium]|nr:hypothetical protein [Terriglobia bacterium]